MIFLFLLQMLSYIQPKSIEGPLTKTNKTEDTQRGLNTFL